MRNILKLSLVAVFLMAFIGPSFASYTPPTRVPINARAPTGNDDINSGNTGEWAINAAGIANGGTGYAASSTFTVTVVGGTTPTSGNPATVSVTTNSSGVVITYVAMVHTGSYTTLPSLTNAATTGGTGTGLTLQLSPVPIVESIWSTPQGSWGNYLNTAGLSDWQQSSRGWQGYALDLVGWNIITLHPTAGTACTTGETITLTGGVQATVTQSGGVPSALTVTYAGNYNSVPATTLSQTSTTGSCTGVTATNTFNGPVVAYGSIPLRAAYANTPCNASTGANCMWGITRPSDGATTNVGWTANGQQDTATMDKFCSESWPSTQGTTPNLGTTESTCFVAPWYDQTGIGSIDATGTAGEEPIESPLNLIGNARSVAFHVDIGGGGPSQFAFLTMPTAVAFTTAASTTIDVVRHTANDLSRGVWSYSASVNGPLSESGGQFCCVGWTLGAFFTSGSLGAQTPQITTLVTSIATQAFEPNVYAFQYGNMYQSFFGLRSTSTLGGGTLGGLAANQGYVELAAHITYNRVLSASEIETVEGALAWQLQLDPQADHMIEISGDSIDVGRRSETGAGYGRLMEPMLNFPAKIFNTAESADTLSDRVTNWTARIAPAFDARYAQNIYWEGSAGNDFIQGASLSTVEGLVQTLIGLVAAEQTTIGKPITFIMKTLLPNGTYGGQESVRLAYNAWLLANFVPLCNAAGIANAAVSDFAGDPEMGNNAANANTLLYNSDGHPTQKGYAILARIAATTLNSVAR